MKTLLKIAIRVGRVITSRWFVIVLLLAVAISCICRGISPRASKAYEPRWKDFPTRNPNRH